MSDEKFVKAINSIYDAALADEGWDAALQDILGFLNRRNGCIQFVDLQSSAYQPLAYNGFDDIVFKDPLEILTVESDPFIQAVLKNPDKTIVVGSQLIPQEEMFSSIFYNEIKTAYDLPYQDAMSGVSNDIASSMGVAAVFDDEESRFFSDEEVRKYTALWPHLERAFHIRTAMSDFRNQTQLSADLIEGLDYAVIGLSIDNKVQLANGKAMELLASGTPFKISSQKLRASVDTGQDKALQQAFWNASNGLGVLDTPKASQLVLNDKDRSRRWTVLISPVGLNNGETAAAYSERSITKLVKISDHSLSTTLRVETLRGLYHLTPAEAGLLTELMSGWSMAAIAEKKGRSVETLRTQLKSLFRKTNTSSQAELTRFLFATPL